MSINNVFCEMSFTFYLGNTGTYLKLKYWYWACSKFLIFKNIFFIFNIIFVNFKFELKLVQFLECVYVEVTITCL
jgi:hypothetical protein